jgi:hypothetical protein
MTYWVTLVAGLVATYSDLLHPAPDTSLQFARLVRFRAIPGHQLASRTTCSLGPYAYRSVTGIRTGVSDGGTRWLGDFFERDGVDMS